VGMASNLAALRALAGEGIQQGHMRLHARKDGLDHAPVTKAGAA
jgi:hydroxymethylglutaryl-CoA reductase